ncbi:hypothetical protein CYLTODRAFT_15768 [Cylindrobasidium torrendii FP15055 ss-10]|uniref:Uncharacterized protein n=1 Tax=Cylindrobasidium torrendii FP15055 ss-10 TaxID=1314674 RepID=A0A0D7B900_9AGAR|nr:hypothetical protein CYLTODRAFT_15768 [Cylindrobasidium torrendii FP15055 ss-10]
MSATTASLLSFATNPKASEIQNAPKLPLDTHTQADSIYFLSQPTRDAAPPSNITIASNADPEPSTLTKKLNVTTPYTALSHILTFAGTSKPTMDFRREYQTITGESRRLIHEGHGQDLLEKLFRYLEMYAIEVSGACISNADGRMDGIKWMLYVEKELSLYVDNKNLVEELYAPLDRDRISALASLQMNARLSCRRFFDALHAAIDELKEQERINGQPHPSRPAIRRLLVILETEFGFVDQTLREVKDWIKTEDGLNTRMGI